MSTRKGDTLAFQQISLRRAGAVGAASLVAVATFAVGALAQTEGVGPDQAASTAVLPQGPEDDAETDDFFAEPSAPAQDAEDPRSQADTAVEQGRQSASGEGSEVLEPEPEPEPPAEDTSGGSESSPSGSSGGGGGSVPSGSPKEIALQMVLDQGWDANQFHDCLEPLWERESNWNHTAQNPSSGAYGIPQSLPGDKMASHGDDWRTNPATQISWGISYIKNRYSNPCGAWSHSQANNWY